MLEYADNPNLETKLKNLAETYEIIEQKSEIIESLELELEEYFEGELRMYGKSHRLGRKMGHINFADSDRENLLRKMEDAEQRI